MTTATGHPPTAVADHSTRRNGADHDRRIGALERKRRVAAEPGHFRSNVWVGPTRASNVLTGDSTPPNARSRARSARAPARQQPQCDPLRQA
jgi:hypothetical protein